MFFVRSFLQVPLMALALLAAGCAAPAGGEDGPVVLAAASMHEALVEIADDWEGLGHARPVLSFAGTPALARQIAGGAPADIVISADTQWMDWLAERDLVDAESRTVIAANTLVYVLHDAASEGGLVPPEGARLAMGDPASVPAGRYAKAALQRAGLWDALSANIIPTENVRAALVLVERGEAEAGIVYASDARAAPGLATLPFDHKLPPDMAISYPAAMIKGARHDDAQRFVQYLASPQASAVFCAHGFTMPPGLLPC